MGIDTQDAAAAKRRAETRAVRTIVRTTVAVWVAAMFAFGMRARDPAVAQMLGERTVWGAAILAASGWFVIRVVQPTLRLVLAVGYVVLTGLYLLLHFALAMAPPP